MKSKPTLAIDKAPTSKEQAQAFLDALLKNRTKRKDIMLPQEVPGEGLGPRIREDPQGERHDGRPLGPKDDPDNDREEDVE
jgi:hypothetical protein